MKIHFKLAHGKTMCGLAISLPDRWGNKRPLLTTFSSHKVSCFRCLSILNRKLNRLTEIQLVHMNITTLCGRSLGATHWYVELQTEDEEGELEITELSHPLSTTETNELNQSEEYTIMRDFKVGEKYSGFWSPEKALEAGQQQWREIYPAGKFLVSGRAIYLEPRPVIDTIYEDDENLKAAADEIVRACEAIGWFDNPKNDKLMDQYTLQWQILLRERINS